MDRQTWGISEQQENITFNQRPIKSFITPFLITNTSMPWKMSTRDFTRVHLGLQGSNHLESWDHVFINYVDKHHHDFDLFHCKVMFVSSKNGGGSFNQICDKSILHGNLLRHWRNMHPTHPLNVLISQCVCHSYEITYSHINVLIERLPQCITEPKVEFIKRNWSEG